MSSNTSKNSVAYVHAAICVLIMFIIGFLPPFGSVTVPGMKVLGAFLGMMYGWIFCGYIWPSLLGLLFFGFSGLGTVAGAFNSGFGNATVVMIIACFVFAGLIEDFKIGDALANKVFGMKFFIGKPWLMVAVLILSADYISSISNTFLIFFIYCGIIVDIAEKCGWQKGDMRVSFLIGAVMFAASMGSILLPFHMTALLFIGFMTSAVGLTIPYGLYIIWMFVIQTIAMLLLIVTAKFIFRLDFSALAEGDFFADKRGKKLEKTQKIGLLITLLFIIAMMSPDFLPEEWAVTVFLKDLGLVGVIAVILVVVGIVRTKEGRPLGDLSKFSRKGINWDVTWLLVATMPIASALSSADCGITATVVAYITPMLQGMSPLAFTTVLVILLGILTQVFHNLVLGALFIPLASTLLLQMGGSPIIMALAATLVVTPALGTPAGAAQSPLFHGHEWVRQKYAYIWGFIFLAVLLLATCVCGLPLGSILF